MADGIFSPQLIRVKTAYRMIQNDRLQQHDVLYSWHTSIYQQFWMKSLLNLLMKLTVGIPQNIILQIQSSTCKCIRNTLSKHTNYTHFATTFITPSQATEGSWCTSWIQQTNVWKKNDEDGNWWANIWTMRMDLLPPQQPIPRTTTGMALTTEWVLTWNSFG